MKINEPYFVYILFSLKDKNFYIGFTSNLSKRMYHHELGKNISTKYRRPLILIFYEVYLVKSDAIRREKYFKTTMGKKALKMMLSEIIKQIGI